MPAWATTATTFSINSMSLTAYVTAGYGETGSEAENRQSSEQSSKNAASPSRPMHAVLARFETDILS
jgi:hypothetical protein